MTDRATPLDYCHTCRRYTQDIWGHWCPENEDLVDLDPFERRDPWDPTDQYPAQWNR